jgi:hypothetical protein
MKERRGTKHRKLRLYPWYFNHETGEVCFWKWDEQCPLEVYLNKWVAWYHGDAARKWNAPSGYRRWRNAQLRELNRRELHKGLNSPEMEVLVSRQTKDAAWFYW